MAKQSNNPQIDFNKDKVMQSAFEILSVTQSLPIFKRNSQRDVIMKDIYDIYISEKQRVLRKKANWKRYCLWLRENRLKHSNITIEKFKKNKQFIKELSIDKVAILLSRNKIEVLYRILSEAKDLNNRNGNASALIIASRFI